MFENIEIEKLSIEEIKQLEADCLAEQRKLELQLELVCDGLRWRMFMRTEGAREYHKLLSSRDRRIADEPVEFSKKSNVPPKGSPAEIKTECLYCRKQFLHYQSIPQLYCSRDCYHTDISAMKGSNGLVPQWGSFTVGDPALPTRENIRKIFPDAKTKKGVPA